MSMVNAKIFYAGKTYQKWHGFQPSERNDRFCASLICHIKIELTTYQNGVVSKVF